MNNEPEETEPEATLWFDSGLTDQDINEASHCTPQYEYGVTGIKRIKGNAQRQCIGRCVTVNEIEVGIIKYYGKLYCMRNACPHQKAPLHLGDIEDINGALCLSCPRHHWPFALETGKCMIGIDLTAECFPIQLRKRPDGKCTLHVGFQSLETSLFSNQDF
uniref:Uncharacterized protein AlNc14C13G1585 n=1 Tax=Albugo laibachii Nc14 TaxID=890382 RepID=F0W3M4_9STRA|nr:conserved hypothetical protein [Albugo laibachii Nc14]CCA16269.1 conserved hypothetical protein [Albugo laibachii Nc14]|eukprot:CCA16269.1 conserved hypothetical protein [Albugo laibachii Nc14]